MRKATSILLALALVVALGAAAYAVNSGSVQVTITTNTAGVIDTSDATQAVGTDDHFDIPITGTLNGSFNENEVEANFYVLLKWAVESDLTYTIEATDYAWTVWDDVEADKGNTSDSAAFIGPVSAGYVGDGDWSGKATIDVSLENWSNRALSVGLAYADKPKGGDIYVDIDTAAVRSFDPDDNTDWTAAAAPADGGTISLDSAAADAYWGAAPSADNVTTGAVTLSIDADSNRDADGKSLMQGDITQGGISIGTLTVTITSVNT